jgi:8-oxo-dGTP pyrophosphatase MutT (NUDIX family)
VGVFYGRFVAMSKYVRQLRDKVGHDLLFWPSVGCVVRDDDDRLLLVRHVEGWWTLPGGSIDPGETPAEAARRETREEASVEVELLRLIGVYGGYPDFHGFYANGDEIGWVTTVFEGRVVAGVAAPGDDETAEVQWVTLDEASALEITPSLRHILTCVREGRMFDS